MRTLTFRERILACLTQGPAYGLLVRDRMLSFTCDRGWLGCFDCNMMRLRLELNCHYPILRNFEREGLAITRETPGGKNRGYRPRIVYELTEQGQTLALLTMLEAQRTEGKL